MKQNRVKIIFICLALLLCTLALIVTGCKSGQGEETSTDDANLSEVEKTWRFINENMENYSIIFSADADTSSTKMIRAFSGTVMKVTGKSATLYNDADTEIPSTEVGEIIMGTTNRLGSRYQSEIKDADLGEDDFRIEYIGKDVVVHYNGIGGLSNAILELLGYMAPGDNVDTVFLAQLDKIGFSLGSVRPKNIYADGMMLQRNRVTTFIGTAEAGVKLTAKLLHNGEAVASGECVAKENGDWDLPMKMPEGSYNNYDLVFYVKDVPVQSYTNVLVGELWIATGQSNMAYTLAKDVEFPTLKFTDNYIRILHCAITSDGYSPVPVYENSSCTWYSGDNMLEMANSTAVGYYFAQELRESLDMPVGLVFYAVGGTPIRSWLSPANVLKNEQLLSRYKANGYYVAYKDWDPKASTAYRNSSALYNTCTAAVQGITVGGVLWYQGEQDLGETDPYYATELEILYNQFRDEFGWSRDEDMPFALPDLMPYMSNRNPMFQSEIAIEMTDFYLAHPDAVSLVQISDASPEFNSNNNASHPNSKRIAGTRLGKAAYMTITGSTAYPSSSPVISGVRRDGNALIVSFDNVADGLCMVSDTAVTVGDQNLHGFTIADSSGVYVMAKAEIISPNEVKVWNDVITKPVAVSYSYGFLAFYSNLGCTYQGDLLYMALPFSYNVPANAKQLSWIPWANCDQEILWRVSRESVHDGRYQYAWSAKDAELTYNAENAFEGRFALALAYGNGSFSALPCFSGNTVDGVRTFKDLTSDYTPYKRIKIMVRNDGTQPVNFDSLSINNLAYFKSVTGTDCAGGVIPADGQWHTLVVDMTAPTTKAGGSINATSYVRAVTQISINFNATASGTLYLDDVELWP